MWWLVPAALTAVGTIVQTKSANDQNKQQLAINEYNANAQYQVSLNNINSQYSLSHLNASLMNASASMQNAIAGMQQQMGMQQGELIRQVAQWNAQTVLQTNEYNNSLLDEELALMWDAMDLDLLQLQNIRASERGEIRAQQAASGVVMDQDSPADVIVHQQTQEALDAMIIRHNADISASRILNAQAQNSYGAQVESLKIRWEGEMGGLITEQNALMQATGTRAGAASTALQAQATLIGADISRQAGLSSAEYQYQAGLYGAQSQYDMNQDKIGANFISGMFSAASAGVSGYYMANQPTIDWSKLFGSGGGGTAPATTAVNTAPYSSNISPTTYKFSTGYEQNFSLATPGSSMFGG